MRTCVCVWVRALAFLLAYLCVCVCVCVRARVLCVCVIERKRRGEAMLDAQSVAQRGVPPPSSESQLALTLAHPTQCLLLYSGQYDVLFSN